MMANTKNPITIDGVEYTFEDMTEQQKALVNHCLDLDRKIANAQFQLDQLRVGKDAFFAMLKQSLAEQPEHAEEVEPQAAGLTD
jgi:hypothetical protein